MSNVIDLLSLADKVAVELHPLDQVHAEASRELADLEARIDAARAKAQASLDAKASLSARFEDIVGQLEAAGVDRATVQKAVDERIAFLMKVGALKAIPTAEARAAVPAQVAEPKREEREPAKVVSIETVRPEPVPAAVVETPKAEVAPPVEPAPAAVEEEPVIELPALRRAAESQSSVLPAARQRRPRTIQPVETLEPAEEVPASEAPGADTTEVAAAAEQVEVPTEPVPAPVEEVPAPAEEPTSTETEISASAYGAVLSGLDGDAEEETEEGNGESDAGAGAVAEERPEEEPAEVAEEAAPEAPAEQPKAEEKKEEPADDGDAYIPAFLRG